MPQASLMLQNPKVHHAKDLFLTLDLNGSVYF